MRATIILDTEDIEDAIAEYVNRNMGFPGVSVDTEDVSLSWNIADGSPDAGTLCATIKPINTGSK